MSSLRAQAFLVLYGPSCLGFIVLVITCIFAKRMRWVFLSGIVAVALHLLAVFVLAALIGSGEAWSGQGESHDYPLRFCIIGLTVLAVPPILRFIYEAVRLSISRAG